MRKFLVSLVVLAATSTMSAAQESVKRPEIRPFMGVSIPTGPQRDYFGNAAMFGLQAALEMKPSFHLLGTFGYVPGEAKYAGAQDGVQIFQYDLGFELNMVRELGDTWLFKPFFGLGAGARSYLYDDDALANQTCASGYAALGTEFELHRTSIRLEARDNLFCYRSPLPNVKSQTRNDVGLSAGIAYHFR